MGKPSKRNTIVRDGLKPGVELTFRKKGGGYIRGWIKDQSTDEFFQ